MKIILWILLSAAAVIATFILILSVSTLAVDPKKEYENDSTFYRFLLNCSVFCAIPLCRIRVHVTGESIVPKNHRFVLVSNHLSNFDPIVQWYVLKDRQLAFLSKEENMHIPIWGRIVRRCCTHVIDRENPRKAMTAINSVAEMLKEDAVSVGVYPEGTRSKTGELLPFHNGVFKIAQKANVPMVVSVIQGTEQIHRNFPFHHTDVYVDFIEVIPSEELAGKRTNVIGERVRADILTGENDDDNRHSGTSEMEGELV